MRGAARIGLWLAGGLVALAGGLAIAGATLDLRRLAERQIARSSGRAAHVGGAAISWGNPIVVRLSDFRLANAPWGEAANLIELAGLSVEIEPWPLLRGRLRLRRMTLERPVIALERDANHVGNWKLNAGGAGGAEPARRAELPFIADLALDGGRIRFRTTGGALLRIGIESFRLHAPAFDAPVAITAAATYNDVPVAIKLQTQSFAVLGRTEIPFGFELTATSTATGLTFHGTATRPLDFDGLEGALAIRSARLDDWLAIFGSPDKIAIALDIAGPLAKQGDHWRLPGASGRLAGTAFSGLLALDEGRAGTPDHFTFDLDFAALDLRRLAGLARGGGTASALPLRVERRPTETYDIRLGLRQARYGGLALGDVRLAATLRAAKVTLSELTLGVAGGAVRATASAEPAGSGGRATIRAMIHRADATAFARLVGGDASALSGRLDGAASFEIAGETSDAWRSGGGQVVLGITQGRIARDLLEKVSTNLSQIFRRGSGSAALACLVGVATIRAGQASVAPLRLRTAEGNLFGGGSIDLARSRIDLRLKSEAKSTGLFALDLPVEIAGSLANPNTGLSKDFDADAIAAQARRNTAALSADTLAAVGHNPCLR